MIEDASDSYGLSFPMDLRRVRLRPVMPEDYDFLYRAEMAPDVFQRWRVNAEASDPQEFAQSLRSGVLCNLLGYDRGTGSPIAQYVAYQPNLRHGHCYFGMLRFDRSGVDLRVHEGAIGFIEFLFRNWDLQKVYVERVVPEGEVDGGLSQWRILTQEARLSRHIFRDGKYQDLVISAIWRDTWRDRWPTLSAFVV